MYACFMPASTTDPKQAVLAVCALLLVFFAPTLLAIGRQRGTSGATFWVTLLIGWTGIGWLLAWIVALRDYRLRVNVTSLVRPTVVDLPPGRGLTSDHHAVLAPDGRHWWDGSGWRDGWECGPRAAVWSPDEQHWWSGVRWIGPSSESSSMTTGPTTDSSATGDLLPEEPEWWRRVSPPPNAA